MKAPPAIIAANCVSLCVADMIICGNEYADGVCGLDYPLARSSEAIVEAEDGRFSSIDIALTWEAGHDGLVGDRVCTW